MKFAVALMLTTFGIFWSPEGAGALWPGGATALPLVLSFVVGSSMAFVALMRRCHVAFSVWRRSRDRDDGRSLLMRIDPWWLLPIGAAAILGLSLRRAIAAAASERRG